MNYVSLLERICAWALLDEATYEEKTLTDRDKETQRKEKQLLADNCLRMNKTLTRKDMTTVGWSPNLLKNSSAEVKKST